MNTDKILISLLFKFRFKAVYKPFYELAVLNNSFLHLENINLCINLKYYSIVINIFMFRK